MSFLGVDSMDVNDKVVPIKRRGTGARRSGTGNEPKPMSLPFTNIEPEESEPVECGTFDLNCKIDAALNTLKTVALKTLLVVGIAAALFFFAKSFFEAKGAQLGAA